MTAMHNTSYLPHKIRALPHSVYGLSCMRERCLFNALKKRVDERLPLADMDLRQLANFSSSAAEFLVAGSLNPREVEVLLENPLHRFEILLEAYDDLAARHESVLWSDPESVERLVVYLRKRGRPGQLTEAEYLQILRCDPDRYLRLVDNPSDEDRDALLRETLEKRHSTPEHAYFYLKVNGISSFDAPIAKALGKSEYHSYLAAVHLRELGASSQQYAGLVSDLHSPRWIFHALRDGVLAESDRAIDRLVASPAWAVEWLVSSRAPLAQVERVYTKCFMRSSGAATFHDLHLWFQRRQIATTSPQAGPGATATATA